MWDVLQALTSSIAHPLAQHPYARRGPSPGAGPDDPFQHTAEHVPVPPPSKLKAQGGEGGEGEGRTQGWQHQRQISFTSQFY